VLRERRNEHAEESTRPPLRRTRISILLSSFGEVFEIGKKAVYISLTSVVGEPERLCAGLNMLSIESFALLKAVHACQVFG
jgi:hypothetical protein